MPVITEAAIKELAGFRSEDAPVVSCYLDVDGRRQVRPQDIERRLAALVRDAANGPSGSAAAADLDRITEHVDQSPRPLRGPGPRAVLVCAEGPVGGRRLPVPVANRIVVNQSPAVGTLESIVQELEPLGVLLVDRQRARMFVFQFGELVERSELFEALPRDYDEIDDAGRGQHERLQDHTDELATQHLRHAAEVAFRLHQDRGFGRLTIGASDEINAAIEPLLHPYLRERLSPRIGVGAGASGARGPRRCPRSWRRRSSGRKEAAAVARLRDGVGAGSKAVAGLGRHPGGAERAPRRRPAGLGGLHASRGGGARAARSRPWARCAPLDGQEMEHVDDVVHDAVDVALGQSCHVEVCVGNADLDVLGRIGALLRY